MDSVLPGCEDLMSCTLLPTFRRNVELHLQGTICLTQAMNTCKTPRLHNLRDNSPLLALIYPFLIYFVPVLFMCRSSDSVDQCTTCDKDNERFAAWLISSTETQSSNWMFLCRR
jgi:hypothetical protein